MTEQRKWHWVEVHAEYRDPLSNYLRSRKFQYEVSGAGSLYHFEMLMTKQEYYQLLAAFNEEVENGR